MILSDISVRRPVLGIVISLLLVAFGLLSYTRLSLRELPDISPPIVSVETSYPGASAQIVETKITQLLEDAVAGIEGLKSIESTARDGRGEVTMEFNLTRDIEAATNDVRDRVSRILDNLPDEADPPEVSKVEAGADVIMWLNMQSTTMNRLELTDYADRFVVDRLATVDGVARVRIGGGQRYAMRVWLDRQAMAARGVTVADVESALRSENVELPAGRLESDRREFTVRIGRTYNSAEDFRQMVLAKGQDGYLVRLADVARVEIGTEDDRSDFRGNGVNMIGLGVVAQSTANTLEVASGVNRELDRLRTSLPEGTEIIMGYDSTIFIAAALKEVYVTLIVAMVLVWLMIYLFLGNLRAVFIPAVTVPVSLIASMIALQAMGFSINLLTLLALVLAIGLVVDDAIVVLENVHRRIELGEPPLLAAYRGTRQVGFAVLATTAVLVAVFVPLSFLSGNIGRLFREFALAMASAVCFSTLVALTLSPVLCSKLLQANTEKKTWLNRVLDSIFERVERLYRNLLGHVLAHPYLMLAALASTLAVIGIVGPAIPRELAPNEDRGAFFVLGRTEEGSSYQHAVEQMRMVEADLLPLLESGDARRILVRVPASFGGTDVIDGGRGIVMLTDWAERDRHIDDIIAEMRQKFNRHPDVRATPVARQAFGGGSREPVQFVIGGPSYEELAQWRDLIIERASQNPGLVNLDSDYKETRPQVVVTIDQTRAADLGVSIQTVGRTLETMLGGRRVTTYVDRGEEYDVVLEGEEEGARTPDDLANIYVRSERTGELVPMSSLLTTTERAASVDLRRYNRFRSITITANLAKGYTLGEALDYLENLVRTELPATAAIGYKGDSREYREAGSAMIWVFGLALLIVFLVLAAQFESFIHPVIILVTVPLALAGAVLGLYFQGSTFNVYSQIGIVMLIGLAAKNGILIVEFANQLRDEGHTFRHALVEASVIRLRPIAMTGLSTAIGAIPLLMATGAGAASRVTIGIVVFWGLIFSTMLTLFVVPVVYDLLARYTGSPGELERRLETLDREVPNPETATVA